MEVVVSAVAPRLHERPCTHAQIVLSDDIGGGAELGGQLDRVAATHLQAAALVESAAPWEHAGEARLGDHRADYRLPAVKVGAGG